jgi:peroxygenase
LQLKHRKIIDAAGLLASHAPAGNSQHGGTAKMNRSPHRMIRGLIFLGLIFTFDHTAKGGINLESGDLDDVALIDFELETSPTVCVQMNTAIPLDQMTPLQRHLAFFDANADSKVTVAETYRGLRLLNLAPPLALPAAIGINGAMATATAGYPSLTLRIPSIEAGIHGSDSGIYDDNGEFDPERFEAWFTTWDKDQDGGLNLKELAQRLYKEQDLFDVFGIMASGGEFGALYLLAAQDGKVSKERLMALYQGTLFYDLAHERGVPNCS